MRSVARNLIVCIIAMNILPSQIQAGPSFLCNQVCKNCYAMLGTVGTALGFQVSDSSGRIQQPPGAAAAKERYRQCQIKRKKCIDAHQVKIKRASSSSSGKKGLPAELTAKGCVSCSPATPCRYDIKSGQGVRLNAVELQPQKARFVRWEPDSGYGNGKECPCTTSNQCSFTVPPAGFSCKAIFRCVGQLGTQGGRTYCK